jgi:hypothetical protein
MLIKCIHIGPPFALTDRAEEQSQPPQPPQHGQQETRKERKRE